MNRVTGGLSLLLLLAVGGPHCTSDDTAPLEDGPSSAVAGSGASTGAGAGMTSAGSDASSSVATTGAGAMGAGSGGTGGVMATGGSTTTAAGGAGQGGQSNGGGGAGGGLFSNLPVGQCVFDADCPDTGPNGANCNRAAPGGICLGCGASDANCPIRAECNQFGSCSGSCSNNDDCPPGQTCAANGLCRIASCQGGVCPVPWFGCSGSNLCVRLPCGGGEICPAETTCTADLCVEDHAL